jgi:hypothetical protein
MQIEYYVDAPCPTCKQSGRFHYLPKQTPASKSEMKCGCQASFSEFTEEYIKLKPFIKKLPF